MHLYTKERSEKYVLTEKFGVAGLGEKMLIKHGWRDVCESVFRVGSIGAVNDTKYYTISIIIILIWNSRTVVHVKFEKITVGTWRTGDIYGRGYPLGAGGPTTIMVDPRKIDKVTIRTGGTAAVHRFEGAVGTGSLERGKIGKTTVGTC